MKSLDRPYFAFIAILVVGGLFLLFSILRGGAEHLSVISSGRVAHGPAEYPKIFEDALLAPPPRGDVDGKEAGHIQVPPPPFSPDMFPCSECHKDLNTDPKPRTLTQAHEEIVLGHGGENRWCYDCHNPDDRDKLRMANGTVVEFAESYRLCGQCHGEIYRDWRDGIHGRRVGYWDGTKRYLLCAHCHNPHRPRFQALAPLPPPVRPDFLRK